MVLVAIIALGIGILDILPQTWSFLSGHVTATIYFIVLGFLAIAILTFPPSLLVGKWDWKERFPLEYLVGIIYFGVRDLMKSKDKYDPAEERESRRLTEYLVRYRDKKAVKLSLALDGIASELISITSVGVEIPGEFLVNVPVRDDGWIEIFDCWVDWPPTASSSEIERRRDERGKEVWRLPLALTEISCGTGFEIKAETQLDSHRQGGKTRFSARRLPNVSELEPLKISLAAGNCVAFLPSKHPIDRKRVTISWRSRLDSRSSPRLVAQIDRPRPFRLLWRSDNAEYMSLSADAGKDYTRYYLFFTDRGPNGKVPRDGVSADARICLNMYSAEYAAIAEPAFPLFNSGFGLIVAGLAIHVLGQGREAPFFALVSATLTLTLWFAEGIRRRKLFSPSATLSGLSMNGIALIVSAVVFFAYFALFAIAYDYYRPGTSPTAVSPGAPAPAVPFEADDMTLVLGMGGITLGVILIASALRYLGSVQLGRMQGYACDHCEIVFRSRWRFVVDMENERKVFCPDCALKAQQSLQTAEVLAIPRLA